MAHEAKLPAEKSASPVRPKRRRHPENPGRRAIKFGYQELLARVEREIALHAGEDESGRRPVLWAMALHFETEESVVLRRGFDKAYRLAVEGV